MPTLYVMTTGGEWSMAGSPRTPVSEMIKASDIPLRLACGGVGACGLCRIRVEDGNVNDPTTAELHQLSNAELREGLRLACQVRLFGDARIRVEAVAPAPEWTHLPGVAEKPAVPQGHADPASARRSLGVAVDFGTTQIRVALWDLEKRLRLAGRSGPNPQANFGADVLTRLTLAAGSRKSARELAWLASGAIGEALADLSASTGYSLRNIQQVVVVGNTAMLCLLADKQQGALLQPEFWTREIDYAPDDVESRLMPWGIHPNAILELIPPVAGFVGSDFLAAVLATRLTDGAANSLLVDFGTNSEIGLWDGETLWATSVPGGPAFEGSGVSCGMPAERGAIFSVERAAPSREFQYEVVGGGEPVGICGSGLVDAIASLIADGSLGASGRFNRPVGDEGFVIARGRRNITLSQRDVDVFQRAKAATAAGIACLLGAAGRSPTELQRVCVCGTFGRYLNVGHAQEVGLLPDVPSARVELCENAALNGCELLLLSEERLASVAALKRKTRLINLAQAPEFEEQFVELLRFHPMRGLPAEVP